MQIHKHNYLIADEFSASFEQLKAELPPSVPGMAQQYPFISQSRRQSSSMRSGGSDQGPAFPAMLASMESTKSEPAQGENSRLIPEAS